MSTFLATPAIEPAVTNDGGCRRPSPDSLAIDQMVYPGGKGAAGVHQHIINRIPPHKLFLEPFLGAGNIMYRKRPAQRDIGVDVIGGAISTARVRFAERRSCQFFVADAIGVLELLSQQLAAAAVAASFSDTSVSSGAATMAMVASSDDDSFRNVTANLMARAPDVRNVGGGILPPEMTARDVVVYCDPPYLMNTRKSDRRVYAIEPSLDSGRGEVGDHDWHSRLLNALESLSCYVLLSGYLSELYELRLCQPKWRRSSYKVRTRGGETVSEYLWCNFPEPLELHDYRYLGTNRRERERIKRKKQRLSKKLLRMPTLERYAVLAAIREACQTDSIGALAAF
jgi:hypothetical protein